MLITHNVTPKELLQNLIIIVVVSSFLILTVSVVGFYWVYQSYVITDTEADAVSISKSIISIHRDLLLHPDADGVEQLMINSNNINYLDLSLKNFLSPYQIVKIKLFALDKTIIYSTDKSLIGHNDSKNKRLLNALKGNNDSKLQVKHQIKDLNLEERFDIDLVESYVPIYNNQNKIIGCFEIYKDVSLLRSEIAKGVVLSFLILASILGLTFTVSFFIVKQGSKELAEAQKKLHQLATKDSLTGLYSRDEIIEHLKAEYGRYCRHLNTQVQFDLGLILLDIDHFKLINDKYGHPEGDIVLRAVADCMKQKTRDYGSIGRYGGEEFLIILPGENIETCAGIAERIRQALAELEINIGDHHISVTASFGVSCADQTEDDYQLLVKRADTAMYDAKNAGRNRVVVN